MKYVYLIERVEIDPLENRLEKAVVYEKVGVVTTDEEMQRLVEHGGMISPESSPWPCKYVNKGKSFPRIKATKLLIVNKV